MRFQARTLFPFVALIILLLAGAAAGQSTVGERPLSNADIVTLSKAGLGDEVVISKIEQAPKVDLEVSTEALVRLKQQGVSPAIIGAMLKRASPAKPSYAQNPSGPTSSPVRLFAKEGPLDLIKMTGSVDYGSLGTKTFHTFPGLSAQTRTKDRQPTLLIATAGNPQGQYYVVKADANPKKRQRSVKIGAGMLGMRNATAPDEDWIVSYESRQESPGIWRLTLSKQLEPGEYGVYLANPNQLAAGDLYDFGVD